MNHIMLRFGTPVLILFALRLGICQDLNWSLHFEAASIKPTDRRGACDVGPGITQFWCKATVNTMVVFAFGLSAYQYSLSASEGQRYEVIAKVPAAVSEEIPKGAKDGHEACMAMLRNLLVGRFKLAFHYQKKQLEEYSLVVAKSGPKVTPSPAESLPDDDLPPSPIIPRTDAYYAIAPPIVKGEVTFRRDHAGTVYLASTGATIDQFAEVAKLFLGGLPVVDATELKGRYDFRLTFGASRYESPLKSANDIHAPDIQSAARHQLGLELVKKRALLNTFVVDHIEKPSLN